MSVGWEGPFGSMLPDIFVMVYFRDSFRYECTASNGCCRSCTYCCPTIRMFCSSQLPLLRHELSFLQSRIHISTLQAGSCIVEDNTTRTMADNMSRHDVIAKVYKMVPPMLEKFHKGLCSVEMLLNELTMSEANWGE